MDGAQGRTEKGRLVQADKPGRDNFEGQAKSCLPKSSVPPARVTQPASARQAPNACCPVEAASQADAAWFRANPHRRHRIRPAVPGEFAPQGELPPMAPGFRRFVAVRQIQPGFRVRIPFRVAVEPAQTEGAARAVFAHLIRPETAAARTAGVVGHA